MEWNEEPQKKRPLPPWLPWAAVIAALSALLLLLIDFYLGGPLTGGAAGKSSPAPHASATPIVDAAGQEAPLDAYILDVGQGNCAFFTAPDGKTLLVDAGNAAAGETVAAFLEGLGVTRLDLVFVTAASEEHAGGMARIAEDFDIGVCYLSAAAQADSACAELLAVLAARGVPVETALADYVSVVPWAENAELRILSPYDVDYRDAPDQSVMLRVKYGASAVLLASDAEALAERMAIKALPNRDLHAKALVVGSHGSGASTSAKFLATVHPEIAIISCGASGEGPDAKVLSRLESAGAAVLRTDIAGNVHLLLDGAAVQVVE